MGVRPAPACSKLPWHARACAASRAQTGDTMSRAKPVRVPGAALSHVSPQPPELRTRRSRVRWRPAGGRLSVCAGAGKRDVLQPELAAGERPAPLVGDGDKP